MYRASKAAHAMCWNIHQANASNGPSKEAIVKALRALISIPETEERPFGLISMNPSPRISM